MNYKIEVGVRITDEDGEQTLAQTSVEADADSAAEAVVKNWSEAGSNIASLLGIDPRRQFDILSAMFFDRFREVLRGFGRGR